MTVAIGVGQAMTNNQQESPVSLHSRKYKITLASRGGLVVYTDSPTQQRILESADSIIIKANAALARATQKKTRKKWCPFR